MALIRYVAERPAPERLAKARAALAEVEQRKEVAPVKAAPNPVQRREKKAEVKAGFDRNAYQREYMRGWRAKRRANSTDGGPVE